MKFNILDLLLPRETKFFKYMSQQTEIFIEGCEVFSRMTSSIERLSEDELKNMISRIDELEQKGDNVEHLIIDELHNTFITPFDREDIHMIAINLDKSLDILNSISRKFEIYGIRKVPVNVCRFADIIVEISLETGKLFSALDKREDIKGIVKRMHELENKADNLFNTSVAELFRDDSPAVEIIKFKDIYEHLESIVDSVDFVGKIVRGIVVKQG